MTITLERQNGNCEVLENVKSIFDTPYYVRVIDFNGFVNSIDRNEVIKITVDL